MPAKVRHPRESIIAAAVRLVRRSGPEALNARALAKEMGCSTQPIFRVFDSMEQIHAEVMRCAVDDYNARIQASAAMALPPYKATGMAYIRFAMEEPVFFRMVFMRDRHGQPPDPADDANMDYVLATIMKVTGYTRDQALRFHHMIWIFVHGLAVLCATGYAAYTQDEISQLLTDQFYAIKNTMEQ